MLSPGDTDGPLPRRGPAGGDGVVQGVGEDHAQVHLVDPAGTTMAFGYFFCTCSRPATSHRTTQPPHGAALQPHGQAEAALGWSLLQGAGHVQELGAAGPQAEQGERKGGEGQKQSRKHGGFLLKCPSFLWPRGSLRHRGRSIRRCRPG